jgi:iron(II)-dependent oxidoreductase
MPTIPELGLALAEARERTDALFRLVKPECLYHRPIPQRHRILFYIGHLEAFDWNLIGRYALDVPPFHETFDRLFAFGIDPPPGELPSDKPSDWPSIAELERYNQRVRDELDERLEAVPEQLLHVAIEHRLMHAETFAYILHQLPYEGKRGTATPGSDAPIPRPATIEIPAARVRMGIDRDEAFGWDNEFQSHPVDVEAFAMAKYKVTNGEYLEFVRTGADAPFFWGERDGVWVYRGMFGEMPLPAGWPVYVTQQQAEAYARWRGKRLPTEAEFQSAAQFDFAVRKGAAPAEDGNFNFRRWDPEPVTTGDRAGTPNQLFGNGWEWTSTPFAPFPGFEAFPFYRNYSEPFFDGQHYVLKGASPVTAACMVRPSFRNWFRPEYPYIYASFRTVDC